MVVVMAVPVLAHHPVISANAVCEDDGSYLVNGTAAAWNGNTDEKKTNPSIEVHRDGYSGPLVASGYFAADNGFSFDWTDSLPAGTVGPVTYVVIATEPWASGQPPRGEGNLHRSQTVVVELPECEVPSEVTVQVTPGVCRYDDQTSLTTVTVVIDPSSGATVTIMDGDGIVGGPFTGTGGEVVLGPGTYTWTAVAMEGFDLVGPGEGEFTTNACPPPPRRTTTTAPPTGAIGDLVWEDTNADGHQGDFEAGVAGVTVTLFDSNGTVLGTTATDSVGNYLFTGLAEGSYHLRFGLPDGFEFSPLNAVAAALDSDAAAGGLTVSIALGAGETDLTWDAGIFRTPQVLPQVITTTTAPATPETLPFTGSSNADVAGAGIALFTVGALVLLVAGRREGEKIDG